MTPQEIQQAYTELSADEAFEAFDAAMVDNATVAVVLGQEVGLEYGFWVYRNLK